MNELHDDSSFILQPSSFFAAIDEGIARRVLLFGGKGGVGKTTVSVFAALHLAKTRRVILFTTDPASNLGDVFRETSKPRDLETESLNADQLYARFLDDNLAQFLELGDRGTYLDKDELRRFFELSLPGADELMAWMRIGELAETNPDATIVVDTAPTGHTLRMLGAAEHFRQFAAALESMQEKHREMVRQLTRRSARDAIDAFLDDFEARARRRRELLTDPARAAFVAVTLSEPWVVEQTKRLIAEVRSDGIDVPLVVLNRAIVDPDCARDLERQKRDAEARATFERVIDFPRSCEPLWNAGVPPAGPQPSRLRGVSMRRVTFFAGKGGVGKTTCASSVALQLAKTKSVTLISVDPAHSVRDVFHEPAANLTVETVDTREKWRRFRDSIGEEIARAIGSLTPRGISLSYDTEAMRKLVEIAPPGADELFAITRLADLIADDGIDAIVVDTAPTGHFIRLIDLPQTAGEWVREFMRILLRYREFIPAGSLGEELIRASRALHLVEETMRSDRCEVVVVTRPETIVVAETRRLIAEVERRGLRAGAVIANYVTPENDCRCDQSMRRFEMAALAELERPVMLIERRDEPVTRLQELAELVTLAP